MTGRLQHVDFYQVRLDQKVKTSPRSGDRGRIAPGVRGGAVLVQILNTVEVECLPIDLINSIQVDVSGLMTLNDSITVGDLPVAAGRDHSGRSERCRGQRGGAACRIWTRRTVEEEFPPEGVEGWSRIRG